MNEKPEKHHVLGRVTDRFSLCLFSIPLRVAVPRCLLAIYLYLSFFLFASLLFLLAWSKYWVNLIRVLFLLADGSPSLTPFPLSSFPLLEMRHMRT